MIPCSRKLGRSDLTGANRGRISLNDSRLSSALALALLLNAGSVVCQESQVVQNLGEDFLNYLADMSIENGKIIDQLDMLDLESGSLPNESVQSDVLEENFSEQPAKAQEINVKFKYKDFGSDEKEEQQ